MKKSKVFGIALAFVLALAPATGLSSTTKVDAASHHYYVLKCDTCGTCFSDGAIGTAVMRHHQTKKHGGGWYTKKDVCTSMGCHTNACDKASNNKKYYW